MAPKEIRTWQRTELMGLLQLFNSIFGRIRKHSTAGYTNVKTQYFSLRGSKATTYFIVICS